MKQTARPLACISILLVAAVSWLAYANTLLNGFVFDDISMVLENDWIKEPGHLYEILTTSFWTFTEDKEGSKYYRPMVHLVFAAEYRLFALKPWGWHMVGVLIHTLNGVLVFLLASRLCRDGKDLSGGLGSVLPPLAAALVWAAHPVHVEVVAWVSALSEVGFSCAYLAALYLYIRADQDFPTGVPGRHGARVGAGPLLFAASAGLFALSTMFKETSLTFPAMLLVYDFARRGTGLVRLWRRYIPFGAVVAAYFALRVPAMAGADVVATSKLFTTYHWLINTPPIIMKYIGKLFVPVGLNAYYKIALYEHVTAVVVLSGLAVLGILALIVYSRRSVAAFTAFGLMCVPMLPALYLPALMPMIFAERYVYLPSAGAALLLALGLTRLVRAYGPTRAVLSGITAATLVIVVVFGVSTHQRNKVWRDGYSLWSDTVVKSPANGEAFYNLGIALDEAGKYGEAVAAYRRAIELYTNPTDVVDALINLGNAYARGGNPRLAIESYDRALAIDPASPSAMQNRSYVIRVMRLRGGGQGPER